MKSNVAFYILVPVFATMIINFLLFRFYKNNVSYKSNNPYLPPGYIIGLIWTILFGLLGYSYYLLTQRTIYTYASFFLIYVFFFCVSYPMLTLGFKQNMVILNRIALLLSVTLTYLVYIENKNVVTYVLPLLFWATYVNIFY